MRAAASAASLGDEARDAIDLYEPSMRTVVGERVDGERHDGAVNGVGQLRLVAEAKHHAMAVNGEAGRHDSWQRTDCDRQASDSAGGEEAPALDLAERVG